jgi:imidazolonepropionase-like amidohydrolase
VAITGGMVLPIASPSIDAGTVLMGEGRIVAVGPGDAVRIPDGAVVVDATGLWVLPGLVEAHSHLGIEESGNGWAGDDLNEQADPDGAALRALDALNPADPAFRDALAGGVTTAVVLPGSANPLAGLGVAVKCAGRTAEEMVLRSPVGLKSALGENPKRVHGDQGHAPMTRMGTAALLRTAFTRASEALRAGSAAVESPALAGLTAVLRGELPLLQHAHRADDIVTAIRLADEFGYRLVVNHGTEAHLVADLLAARGIPVVAGPLIGSRTKVELAGRTMHTPGLLARAGVQVAISTDHGTVPIDFLIHQATFAVKEGMDRDEALRSVSLTPARILGLDDRVGSLQPGLDADVVIWSGDPLDVMSRAIEVYVGARRVYEYAA